MKRIIILFFLFISSCNENKIRQKEIKNPKTDDSKIEVLLFGTFHFENFNLKNSGDVLKVNIRDILN